MKPLEEEDARPSLDLEQRRFRELCRHLQHVQLREISDLIRAIMGLRREGDKAECVSGAVLRALNFCRRRTSESARERRQRQNKKHRHGAKSLGSQEPRYGIARLLGDAGRTRAAGGLAVGNFSLPKGDTTVGPPSDSAQDSQCAVAGWYALVGDEDL